MACSHADLPQLPGERFLTNSGLETDLIFHHGYALPLFASFPLVDDPRGRGSLRHFFRQHADLAAASGMGVVLDTPTWRASSWWATQLGYTSRELADVNRRAVAMLAEMRDEGGESARPLVISGCIGPSGDGYHPGGSMTPDEAQRYHADQIATFSDSEVDLVSAFTLTYANEAIGIVRAAQHAGLPVVISFTVETDGRLPDGSTLRGAITKVDDLTDGAAAYFGVNCAHPTHFAGVLEVGAKWTRRIGMIKANASTKSHVELDGTTELDAGDPSLLGLAYARLQAVLPSVTVLGGCCGTNIRHLRAIVSAIEQLRVASGDHSSQPVAPAD